MGMAIILWVGTVLLPPQEPPTADAARWVEQLGAEFQEERTEAFEALDQAGPEANPPLLAGLESPDFRVRRGCLELLTKRKCTDGLVAAALLYREEGERSVQDAALSYLLMCGAFAEEPLLSALSTTDEAQTVLVVRKLLEIRSEKGVETIARLYEKTESVEVRREARQYLLKIGTPAVPHLIRLLGSPEGEIRKDALTGLKGVRRREVLERLIELFPGEGIPECQQLAFDVLAEYGPEAEPAFLRGLSSPESVIRTRSLEGLTRIASERALASVSEQFLREEDDTLLTAFVRYLVSLGLRSEETLMKGLENPSMKIRLKALEGLRLTGSGKPKDLVARWYREEKDGALHRASFEYLAAIGKPAEEELLQALEDPVKEIRRDAAAALGKIGSEKAIPALVDLYAGKEAVVREAAQDALVRMGEPALKKVEWAVREGIVTEKAGNLLRVLFDQEKVEEVLGRLISPDGLVGYSEGQFEGLKELGGERVLPALLRMMDPEYKPRRPSGRCPDEFRQASALRELAIMAVGILGQKEEHLPKIRKMLLRGREGMAGYEGRELSIAAHRLGDSGPVEEFVRSSLQAGEKGLTSEFKEEGFRSLFEAAATLNRIGRRGDARKTYERVAALLEADSEREAYGSLWAETLYNLACLHALTGEKVTSLELLERAIRAGFRDREHIRADGDLRTLREEEAFSRLLQDETLFPEKGQGK